jgi:ribulose bisphosphate carboxylase small subunit
MVQVWGAANQWDASVEIERCRKEGDGETIGVSAVDIADELDVWSVINTKEDGFERGYRHV